MSDESRRKGRPLRLLSGQRVDLEAPEAVKVEACDVYAGLRHQVRFGGQQPVTVLAHLALCGLLARVWVAHPAFADPLRAQAEEAGGDVDYRLGLLRKELAAYAVAHDLHKTYVPETTPQIRLLAPGLADLEEGYRRHVHEQIGLAYPPDDLVSQFVLQLEHRALVIENLVWGGHAEGVGRHGGAPLAAEVKAGRWIHGVSDSGLWLSVIRTLDAALGTSHPLNGPLRPVTPPPPAP